MSYLNYDGLAYFKSKFTNWVDQNYLSKTNTGNMTIAGNVTFTKPITGDLDGKVKKDWLGQKIDETYIKEIATNDNAGTIVYTKGNGSTNHILIDLLQGATPISNGKAGLVPAPTVSEMNYFLRGDGNWAVPTDVYVNQNLIASSNNNQFPVLLSGTSGTPATKTNATVGYTNVVSVNPLTNALMASQFISKHPTYNRQNAVSSKIQYSLNFTDVVSGAGHNLGEVVGYVDTAANGGEHELGLRLFGNPNVQGTEEDYVYMSVGLSKTNVAYGHAPSTPLPADHNEPTDIITRDWLARNGSETGLVHTSMNETIDGAKTFKKTVTINSGDNSNKASLTVQGNASIGGNSTVAGNSSISGNETVGGTLTSTGKFTANGTAEIKGGSGNNPSLLVTGNETVTGKLTGIGTAEFSGGSGNTPTLSVDGNESVSGNETVGGNISTTNGNISTTNGTVSGKTGSIGTGGLTVAGTTTSTGKITGNGGAEISGGSGLKVNGNETVTGTTTVTGKVTANGGVEVNGSNGLVVNGNETVNGEIYKVVNNTPQEYVSYVTNQQETRNTIITNVVKPNGGLAVVSSGADKGKIYVKTGDGLSVSDTGFINVDFEDPDPDFIRGIVDGMIPRKNGNYVGGLATIPAGEENEGKLIVDFSKMPTDSFEQMLQKLHLPIWVGEINGDSYVGTNFYVDLETGVNTTANGQGRSEDKPWKTIAYATQTLAKNYNISNKNVIINVAGGTYTDAVALPLLQRTTGSVYIRPKTADDVVNIEWTCVSSGASTITHSGGSWVIDNCNIKIILAEQTTPYYHYPHLVWSTDSTGGVSLRSCNFSFVDNTVPVDSTHGLCEARLICASGGNIQLSNDGFYSDHSTAAGRTTTWSGTKTNANILWIHGEFGGNVTLWSGGQDYNLPYTYEVSGKWTRFVNLLSKSQITFNGVGPHAVFSYDITQIGRGSQGYYISSGASASTGASSVEDRENYFPRGYITEEGSETPVANYCNASQFSYISPTN